MKITKKRRKEIERAWQKIGDNYSKGRALCYFLMVYSIELREAWNRVWETQKMDTISSHFLKESYDNYIDLTYLCRALSLNMLLDDNMEE